MKLSTMSISLSLVLLPVLNCVSSSVRKCNKKESDFQHCLTKAVENFIKERNIPFKNVILLHKQNLVNPILLPAANGLETVNLKQILKQLEVSSFSETTCSKVEFTNDPDILKLDCIVPHFRLDLDYELSGDFSLSDYGKGPALVILKNNHVHLNLMLQQKGEYYKIMHYYLSMWPTDIDFDFENLLDVDGIRTDSVKQFLKANVTQYYRQIKESYDVTFGKILASVFDSFPVDSLFEEQ